MKLLESDEKYLESKGYCFETAIESRFLYLTLHDFPFPAAYSPRCADVLVRIPPGYPNAKLDMFWTSPHIKLPSGQDPDRANVVETYLGKKWQRWSRHWPGAWRAGVDGLDTFIAAIHNELQRGRYPSPLMTWTKNTFIDSRRMRMWISSVDTHTFIWVIIVGDNYEYSLTQNHKYPTNRSIKTNGA